MKVREMKQIAGWIADAVEYRHDGKVLSGIHDKVKGLCKKFPFYAKRLKS